MLEKHRTVEIRPVATDADRKAFIRVPNAIYADDPNYVAPLEFELANRLNADKNIILKGQKHQLWIAYKDGQPVGRISAIINEAHLNRHNDDACHFGFFESINEPEVADALLRTAADWGREHGMKKIAGPFNFSVNEEVGLLVDGFDTPPYVMMPHGRRYYQKLVEDLGYTKAIDMYALSYVPHGDMIPPKRKRFLDKAMSKADVTIRNIDMSDFKNEIGRLVDIFNDAWFDNWGFVPFTAEQVEHMAEELRPIISPHNIVFCDYNGEPAAFGLVLPDVNHVARDFGGKLLPFNWAKLLWRLKVKNVPRARMPLMGVRRKLHRRPIGTALAYKIIEVAQHANVSRGVVHSELSWILETNESMIAMLLDMGGEIYKTYRIYEKPL